MKARRYIPILSLFAAFGSACVTESAPLRVDDEPTQPDTYEADIYYEGIDETVKVHKGPDGYYCIRADGRKQDCLDLEREDAGARYDRMGVMTNLTYERCRQAAPGEVLEFGAGYIVEAPTDIHDRDDEVAARARLVFIESIKRGAQEWLPRLHAMGAVSIPPVSWDTLPFLPLKATCDVMNAIARTPGIFRLETFEGGPPV